MAYSTVLQFYLDFIPHRDKNVYTKKIQQYNKMITFREHNIDCQVETQYKFKLPTLTKLSVNQQNGNQSHQNPITGNLTPGKRHLTA